MLRAFLCLNGYTCQHVTDAEQAMAALQETQFHLLISDIGMPGNCSLELVRRVGELPSPPPIILLTGSPTVDTAMQAVGLPVTAYLTKPPNPDELLRTVRQAVSAANVNRAVLASHGRLCNWAEEIGRINDLLQRSQQGSHGAYFDSYIRVTLTNLVAALADFAAIADLMVTSRAQHQKLEVSTLVKALEETIDVIEKTRRNFHSRELAALRKKLEQMVGERGERRKADEDSRFSVKSVEAVTMMNPT